MRTEKLEPQRVPRPKTFLRWLWSSLAFMDVAMRPGYVLMLLFVLIALFVPTVLFFALGLARPWLSPGFIALLSMMTVPMVGSALARATVTGAQLCHQRRLPDAMWAQWLHNCVRHASLAWLVPVVGGTLTAYVNHGATPAIQIAALGSVSMAALTCIGLIVSGLRLSVWWWASTPLLTAMSITMVLGLTDLTAWHDLVPQTAMVASVVSWPVMAWCLLKRWPVPPATKDVHSSIKAPTKAWSVARFASYLARFKPLYQWGIAPGELRSQWTALRNPLMFVTLLGIQTYMASVPWGEPVTAINLWLPLLWVPLGMATLSCKDAHWRHHLRPQGYKKPEIGTHIVMSTLMLWGMAMVMLTVLFVPLALALFRPGGEAIAAYAAKWALMPVFCLLAVATASVIKALDPAGRRTGWLALPLVIVPVGSMIQFGFDPQRQPPVLFVMGLPAVCAMVATSIALIGLANRLWTIERLMQCTQKAKP